MGIVVVADFAASAPLVEDAIMTATSRRTRLPARGQGVWPKNSYARELCWLLRPRRERPSRCRTAEECDELAPSHAIPNTAPTDLEFLNRAGTSTVTR